MPTSPAPTRPVSPTSTTLPPVRRRPGALLPAAVAVLLAVACVTLGPPGAVAEARRTVTALAEALTAPWPGAVQRAQVEAAANVLLFVPVGALAAVLVRRRSPVLPVALGAGLSVLVELVQTTLPGRVPDLADVAANTAGTVVGVALAAGCRSALRRARRGRRAGLVAVPLLLAALAGCADVVPAGAEGAPLATAPSAGTPSAGTPERRELTAEDGWLPDGEVLSPFDDVPALTRLDAALRTAVQDAYRAATDDGVRFHVTTGWRSAAYQQSLFDAAVREHGSPAAARVHVLPADESAHVTGDAVDIGPTDAMYWLSRHGAQFGLCQTYGNELWHYELTVERGGECPAPVADPSAG
ncbi:VanZ family protein [Modestobacter sp. VKM Ac-2986]|uniref:VanZ family protein n=1 Tax=Modestobacter sp. VKM Ac-2986 TaxID=3004140 RepID=UPI0022AA9307|nr:VanZ family protein [Modestobacter sp. VKM Ac-2986]MCZ2829142.1 VanZ family protein [Modestobacter sp. VKM Ac-2986]